MSTKKSILIVDDEPDVLAYLTAVLKAKDFDIHTADNTEEGLRIAEKVKPDLVCLDIMMPRESGISMYAKLKSREDLAHTPVVIISGVEPESEFDFRKLVRETSIPPPEAYLEKPIDVAEFEEAVSRLTAQGNPGKRPSRKGTA